MDKYLEERIVLQKIRRGDMLPRPIRDHLELKNVIEGADFYTLEVDSVNYSVECKQFENETRVYSITKLPKGKKAKTRK